MNEATYTTGNATILEYQSKSATKTIAKTVYPEYHEGYGHAIMRTQGGDPRAVMLLQDDGSPDPLPWLDEGEAMDTMQLQQVRVS